MLLRPASFRQGEPIEPSGPAAAPAAPPPIDEHSSAPYQFTYDSRSYGRARSDEAIKIPDTRWNPWKMVVDAVDYVADAAVDAVTAAASIYPRPSPQPAPLDYCAIVSRAGTIEQISSPSAIQTLTDYREKTIEATDGAVSVTIVAKEVGARLRVGMSTAAILDTIEADQRRGYELYLGERTPWAVRY